LLDSTHGGKKREVREKRSRNPKQKKGKKKRKTLLSPFPIRFEQSAEMTWGKKRKGNAKED